MKSNISKLLLSFTLLLFTLAFMPTLAQANSPDITGEVYVAGTNSYISPGVKLWAKMTDNRTGGHYRYNRTSSVDGHFTFYGWQYEKAAPDQMYHTWIQPEHPEVAEIVDWNDNGGAGYPGYVRQTDSVQRVDCEGGCQTIGYGCSELPLTITIVKPSNWSGSFSTVTINSNQLDYYDNTKSYSNDLTSFRAPPIYYSGTNQASCAVTSAPTRVESDATFSVSVVANNPIGAKPWSRTSNYKLGRYDGYASYGWGFPNGNGDRVSLPADQISPGSSATFTFNVKAPSVSVDKNYYMDVKMVQDGVEWFGSYCTQNIQVRAKALPAVDVTCSQSATTITAGQSVTFSANARGGAGPGTYSYSWDGDASGTGQSITKTFSTAGTYNIYVNASSGNATPGRDQCTITVTNPAPAPTADCKAVGSYATSMKTGSSTIVYATFNTNQYSAIGSIALCKQGRDCVNQGFDWDSGLFNYGDGQQKSFQTSNLNDSGNYTVLCRAIVPNVKECRSSYAASGQSTCTGPSSNISVTPPPPPPPAPPQVSWNSYSAGCDAPHADLHWTGRNVARYELWRYNGNGQGYVMLPAPSPGQTSYRDSTLTSMYSYQYLLYAYNSSGQQISSSWTNWIQPNCSGLMFGLVYFDWSRDGVYSQGSDSPNSYSDSQYQAFFTLKNSSGQVIASSNNNGNVYGSTWYGNYSFGEQPYSTYTIEATLGSYWRDLGYSILNPVRTMHNPSWSGEDRAFAIQPPPLPTVSWNNGGTNPGCNGINPKIDLSWNATNVSRYQLYRRSWNSAAGSANNWEAIISPIAGEYNKTDTGLNDKTYYQYFLYAYNQAGWSAYSSESNWALTNCVPAITGFCTADPADQTVTEGNIIKKVTWRAYPSGGNGTYTYSWSGDASGTTQTVERDYTSEGTKTASVTVSSPGTASVSFTCTATIKTPPLAATCTLNPPAPVAGGSATWTAQPTVTTGGTPGTYTYEWKDLPTGAVVTPNQGTSSSSSTARVDNIPAGNYKPTVTITSPAQSRTFDCFENGQPIVVKNPAFIQTDQGDVHSNTKIDTQ